jgi:hypothetical protein
VKDSASQLRSATRRAKSDVANKLISMCLHELSRKISEDWPIKVDGEEYEKLARGQFGNRCPYCSCDLSTTVAVIEHLDGMNRYRAGLHVPGNVLVACKRCNGEKRRDDSSKNLPPGQSGWEAFLSHDGTGCVASCPTCRYWAVIWPDQGEREIRLRENLARVRSFRGSFPELERIFPDLLKTLPGLLTRLYSDCQVFAEAEIKALLGRLEGGREDGSSGRERYE